MVFLPLFSLEGLEGKMFKPMAFNIAFAMAGSLILALTLIPVLAALILKPKEERDTWLVRAVKRIYVPLLGHALVKKGVVVTFAMVTLVGSLALFPFLGKEFMPQLQEGSIMWRVTGIPSTSGIQVKPLVPCFASIILPSVPGTMTAASFEMCSGAALSASAGARCAPAAALRKQALELDEQRRVIGRTPPATDFVEHARGRDGALE